MQHLYYIVIVLVYTMIHDHQVDHYVVEDCAASFFLISTKYPVCVCVCVSTFTWEMVSDMYKFCV